MPGTLDGLLVVDKPSGPSSHDVVARVRRALGERRIGHTGTLDPLATGVLLLVLGRATRLARFLTARTKTYDAVVRLGVATDTYDADGTPVGPAHAGAWPDAEAVARALDAFRGTFAQQPPAFSAKKVGGVRSYQAARQHAARPDAAVPLPAPVSVTTYALDVIEQADALLTLRVVCSAGFYVRALAHDLGAALGCGAHLVGLRRTETSGFTLDDALPLAAVAFNRPVVVLDERGNANRYLPDGTASPLDRISPQGLAATIEGLLMRFNSSLNWL